MLQHDQAFNMVLKLLNNSDAPDVTSMDDIVDNAEVYEAMADPYRHTMSRHYTYLRVSNDLEYIMDNLVRDGLVYEYEKGDDSTPYSRYFHISRQGRAHLRELAWEKYKYTYSGIISTVTLIIVIVLAVLMVLK